MANIVISGDTSGSVTLSAPAVSGTTVLTLPTTSGTLTIGGTTPSFTSVTTNQLTIGTTQLGAGDSSAIKNRIINGAMVIDQRNAGASVTIPANAVTYTIDRWAGFGSVASKFSLQQNAGSVTPPAGFINYLGATSLSAYSVDSAEQFQLLQPIEGFNTADLGWGTANAKTITISFWVRSSLTGNFGGSLRNYVANRSYPFSYTISAANTWEQKSVTIAGDTSGTWLTNNGVGVYLGFALGVGATFSGTAGAWAAGNFVQPTGSTSVVGTDGATFYITGVQLEVGTQATSFEYRQYGTELALCQRYYWETSKGLGGSVASTTTAVLLGRNPVTMRTAPTVSGTAIEVFQLTVAGSKTQSSFSANSTISDTNGFALECANFSGLTTYFPVGMNSGKVTFSSEL